MLNPIGTRICKSCGLEKSLIDLVKAPSCKYGVRPKCVQCKWEDRQKQAPEGRYNRGITDHGITVEQYHARLNQQGHKCAICLSAVAGTDRNGKISIRFAIDHDHKCCPGKYSCGNCIRGLLCFACNASFSQYECFPQEMETYYSHWRINKDGL
jgi:ribosomal protein L34E